jgi:hypothetical protein
MPRAPDSARPIIEALCEALRNDRRTQDLYIEKAEAIEQDLELPRYCEGLSHLGVRDTFPFEEQTFLFHAVAAFEQNDLDKVWCILGQHERSVWSAKGESRAKWYLVESAAALAQCCEDIEKQLSDHTESLESLVQFYVGRLREMDRLHREFEQAVSEYEWQDTLREMSGLMQRARKHYNKLADATQMIFMRLIGKAGWPLPGMLTNGQVFDRLVAPGLKQNGHRVAYFMVDALRYELGVALEKQLAEDGVIEMQPALAQLPSITPVGMASLLPGAADQLTVEKSDSGLTPLLEGRPVGSVAQRMEAFRRRYGQRFDRSSIRTDHYEHKKEIPAQTDH